MKDHIINKDSENYINPESWVDEHGDVLYTFALIRVREPALAEDIVQETFLAALTAQKKYQGRAAERTWLIGILKHKIIDFFRKSTKERSVGLHDNIETPETKMFDQNGNWTSGSTSLGANPSKTLEQKELVTIFQECLAKLPPKLAQIFVLHELDGLKGKEICELFSISQSNLWVMLYRARLQLRSHMEKVEAGCKSNINKPSDQSQAAVVNRKLSCARVAGYEK